LEDQITIVIATTSHQNNRRDRRPPRVDSREPQDFSADRSFSPTRLKPDEAAKALR